eukprot:jgi/Bigna1/140625/aug1.57_g15333
MREANHASSIRGACKSELAISRKSANAIETPKLESKGRDGSGHECAEHCVEPCYELNGDVQRECGDCVASNPRVAARIEKYKCRPGVADFPETGQSNNRARPHSSSSAAKDDGGQGGVRAGSNKVNEEKEETGNWAGEYKDEAGRPVDGGGMDVEATVTIKNLTIWTTEEQLHDEFKSFGEIDHAIVVRGNHQVSHRYGYIKFRSEESARSAILAKDGHEFQGQMLAVTLATHKDKTIIAQAVMMSTSERASQDLVSIPYTFSNLKEREKERGGGEVKNERFFNCQLRIVGTCTTEGGDGANGHCNGYDEEGSNRHRRRLPCRPLNVDPAAFKGGLGYIAQLVLFSSLICVVGDGCNQEKYCHFEGVARMVQSGAASISMLIIT